MRPGDTKEDLRQTGAMEILGMGGDRWLPLVALLLLLLSVAVLVLPPMGIQPDRGKESPVAQVSAPWITRDEAWTFEVSRGNLQAQWTTAAVEPTRCVSPEGP